MEVHTFDSPEAMVEFMRNRTEAANAMLAVAQRNLTWGSHWVQFYDIANHHLAWGRISTREEIIEREQAAGMTQVETAALIEHTESLLERGYMYGIAYDRFNAEGEYGQTHKSQVWPVEARLFDAMRACGWDHRLLTSEDMRFLLDLAYRQMRAHVKYELRQQAIVQQEVADERNREWYE